MKLTKTQFNKVQKYLKTKNPYLEFKLTETGHPYKAGAYGSNTDSVEIDVDTLFDIVNELMDKK